MHYKRLPLSGLLNARDLGGYPVKSGGTTQFGHFIRCDVPKNLTEADLEFLKNFGVTMSIDFRGNDETERHPSCLERLDWAEYVHCPAFDKHLAFHSQNGDPPDEKSFDWGEKYVELVETRPDWICQTLTAMARARGAVMFNCTTGKDRTGVIAALLLGLAGVPETDIIADYCVSEVYLKPLYNELIESAAKNGRTLRLDSPFFKTAPASMSTLVKHINEERGGAERFIKSCGVSGADSAALRRALLG